MNTNICFGPHPAHFYLEWKMLQTKVVEKIKTHVLCSVSPPPKIVPCVGQCGKIYCRACEATNVNMAHAHCVLDA